MTADEFRLSLHRANLAEFLATDTGQTLLGMWADRTRPEAVDDSKPVTAWVAAHERLYGRNEMTEFTLLLATLKDPDPAEETPDWGVPKPS